MTTTRSQTNKQRSKKKTRRMDTNSATGTEAGSPRVSRQLLSPATGNDRVHNDQNEQSANIGNGQNQDTRQSGNGESNRQRIQQVQTTAYMGSTQKLKIPTPKKLKNVDNITMVRAFVQTITSLLRRIGHVEIQDHIDAVFWSKLTLQDPELFRDGNTKAILKWLSDQVEAEEKRRERAPWKFVGTLKFDPAKGRTLIRSIQLFLMEARGLLKYAMTKDERKVLLTRVIIQLPDDLQYLYGQIKYGRILTLDQIQQAVNKKEEAYGHAVSRHERHRLKKSAHDRILRWKQGTLDVSEIDETEESSESEDSSSSGSESDTRAKKKSKKKKTRGKKKPAVKAANDATNATEAYTNQLEEEDLENLVDPSLMEQKMELRRKIANQKHIAEIAELQRQYEAMLAGAGTTTRQSVNANTVNVDATGQQHEYGEEQVVDAMEVQEFMIQEAKAEKLAVCFGCHQPGHIRRNCPDVTNRYGRPRRLFRLCYNCGGKNHEWKDCDKELKPYLKDILDRSNNRNYRGYKGRYGQYPANWGQENAHERNYRQNQDNQQNYRQQNDQPNYQITQKDGTTNAQEVEKIRFREALVITLEANLADIEVDEMNIEGTERVSTVVRPNISVSKDKGKTWQKVGGKVDSGADSSVGSWQNHRHLCTDTWNLVGQKLRIRVGGGQTFPVRKKGLIHLKVNDQVLDPCEILLVDCDTWVNLLIGEDFLQTQGLSLFGPRSGDKNIRQD